MQLSYCLFVALSSLQFVFTLKTLIIWNQFQAIKSGQPEQEFYVYGTVFTPFGDVTPAGGLEVSICD